MNLPSIFRRLIISVRNVFNSINIRIFGIGLAILTVILLWLLLASAYLPERYDLEVGDVASNTIVAPRTLTFENEAETERLKQQAREDVSGVYTYKSSVLSDVSSDIDAFLANVSGIVAQERAAAEAASQPYDKTTAENRILSLENLPEISDTTITVLAGMQPERLEQIRSNLIESAQRILQGNVTEATLSTDKARLSALLLTMPLTETETEVAGEIGAAFLRPNYVMDEEKTTEAQEEAVAEVEPVVITVRKGETVLSPGQVVTEKTMATMEALGLTQEESRYGTLMGIFLLAILEVGILAVYINSFEKRVRESRSMEFIVASLFLLFTALDRISIIEPLSPLLVPIAALGIIGTLILRTRLASILVIFSIANLLITGGSDPHYALVGLFSGISAVYLVTNVTQRRDLLKAGVIAGFVTILAAVGIGVVIDDSFSQFLNNLTLGAVNGILVIVVSVGLLTIYEMVFNLPTPLKLLELSDPTRPILKELMMKAPGTYNHSIIMGNIAETAAEAIGANTLLARVGAYYHDIGKLNRPEYFIENQFHIKNPHDRLTPGLSKLAITAHVRDGVDIARKEGLPPEIVDIIREHHGTTVLSYFYHKAQLTAGIERIDEESYRYAGRKPASREAAIIMLADSVEAAVRSLKNPTMRNIKTTIRNIFDQRLKDGQLSESDMTFGDLEKVRVVFEKSLQGFGAMRISYPGDDEPKPARGQQEAGSGRGPVKVKTERKSPGF